MRVEEAIKEAEEMICPACGYYCLGKGGLWCIDKKSFVDLLTKKQEAVEHL